MRYETPPAISDLYSLISTGFCQNERTMSIDTLIAGGRLVDGTGNPWWYGDVAIQGDRIADLTPPGQIPPEQARVVVDASGMVVCPGFIDIQSHSILTLMRDGRSLSKIAQG